MTPLDSAEPVERPTERCVVEPDLSTQQTLSIGPGEAQPGENAKLEAKITSARVYAELGFKVALAHWPRDGRCSCGDAECGSPGKHPFGGKGWQERATSDPSVIRAQLEAHPQANIGLVTGRASGLVAIDVDGAEGAATLERLEREHSSIGRTPTVTTSRGYHLLFAVTPDMPEIPCRVSARGRGLGTGVDVRGEGGFIVVPPSVHASGHVYCFADGLGLADVELLLFPAWVWKRVVEAMRTETSVPRPAPIIPSTNRRERYASAALEKECSNVRATSEGSRNDALNVAAFNVGLLVHGGALDLGEARSALVSAAIESGLGEREVTKTIASAFAGAEQAEVRSGPARDLPRPSEMPVDPPERIAPVVSIDSKRPQAESHIEVIGTERIFERLPPPQYVIPALHLGPGRPAMVAGYGASAKTLALQSLELAIASGRKAWDHYETVRGIVLHIDYEQGEIDTCRRFQRLARGHGIDPRELAQRLRVATMPRIYATTKGAEDEFRRLADGVDLIVIDTLRAMAPGLDENSSDARAIVDMWTRVSLDSGSGVVILHHAGKASDGRDARARVRGSSALFDASGAAYLFERQPGSSATHVRAIKASTSACGTPPSDFDLVVEDVAIDGDATAGVAVRWSERARDDDQHATESYDRDSARLLGVVVRDPGASQSVLEARSGMRATRARAVLAAMVAEGKLRVVTGPRATKAYWAGR